MSHPRGGVRLRTLRTREPEERTPFRAKAPGLICDSRDDMMRALRLIRDGQRGAQVMLQHIWGDKTMAESDLASIVDQSCEMSDDREDVRAFLEKRSPRFSGT